jgi:hypothetical protein
VYWLASLPSKQWIRVGRHIFFCQVFGKSSAFFCMSVCTKYKYPIVGLFFSRQSGIGHSLQSTQAYSLFGTCSLWSFRSDLSTFGFVSVLRRFFSYSLSWPIWIWLAKDRQKGRLPRAKGSLTFLSMIFSLVVKPPPDYWIDYWIWLIDWIWLFGFDYLDLTDWLDLTIWIWLIDLDWTVVCRFGCDWSI